MPAVESEGSNVHSRPSRPARWWARTLVLPILAVALVAAGGTAAHAAADTAPPSAPGPITVAGTTADSVELTWAASTDNVAVVSYHVTQIFTDMAFLHTTTTNSIVITGMLPSRTYTFGVSALDAAGNRSTSPPSLRFTQPPGDSQPPTAPSALTVGLVGETAVGLSWGPSTDNVVLLQYEVLSLTPTGNTVVARVGLMPPMYPSTAVTVSALTPRTTYTFAVRTQDEAGNYSALSSPVTVTTGPAPEPQPTCAVGYRTMVQWQGGVVAEMTIRNTGPVEINGWTLRWSLPNSVRIVTVWGAELISNVNGVVTVRNANYNATIRPGATVTMGYQAAVSGSGGSIQPTSFVLNGELCRAG
ncbi:cellulose binding domain-containing protein [Plantactinospora sp. S1510]|uniref:Cellulose binding domain-containing protein n=1 Tax=Plantactinospora alkalitolerans TaxID=2789879 RepID=A0ABS0H8D7_9ACTN|nr:cellulose binding domain-containing protein [Plantactinospora alkalitolerans]MBF9134579.1 cellulose binding domain-containing protein [Plantactinospora alkalitolerans]